MKTSNKIIVAVFGLLFLASTAFQIAMKRSQISMDEWEAQRNGGGNNELIVGSGVLTTEEQEMDSYSKISTHGAITVVFIAGLEKASITAEENILSRVQIINEEGHLTVSLEGNNRIKNMPVIKLPLPKQLSSLEHYAIGDLSSTDTLYTEMLTLKNDSPGDIHLVINSKELSVNSGNVGETNVRGSIGNAKVESHGANDITIKGMNGDVEIEMTNVGDVDLTGTIRNLKADTRGAGDLTVDGLQAINVSLYSDNVGDVELYGTTEKLSIEAFGAGDIEAFQLQAKSATVKTGNVGDVEVFASDAISISADGSGKVKYKGNPTQVKTDENNNGIVEKM